MINWPKQLIATTFVFTLVEQGWTLDAKDNASTAQSSQGTIGRDE